MKLAKSIDELYEEVKGYDLVICNDAPLATALNNRLDKPFLGEFAFTPRHLAGDFAMDVLEGPLEDDIALIRKIADETGYDFRFVHGEIENIKTIRRYKKDVVNYLRGRSKKVYDAYVNYRTLDKAMEFFDGWNNDFYKNKKIAIIGAELFDDLDKCMNPRVENLDYIELFKDEDPSSYRIPEIRELNSNREIAENIVSLIDQENANDVAIVMDVEGNIAECVKSSLYRKKIHFINKLYVKDLNYVRDYIEFVSLALSFDIMEMKNIREIISLNGGYIPKKYDNYLVQNFDFTTLKSMIQREESYEKTVFLIDLMKHISDKTFDELREFILPDHKKGQVKVILDNLGLSDKKVTKERMGELVYAVNNITDMKHNEQISPEENDGVLLVDCCNSVYVDRLVVFYVGLSSEWEPDINFLNNIDYRLKDDATEVNATKFQILLQQGTVRFYVVTRITDGENTIPCSLFNHAENGKVCDEFSELTDKVTHGLWFRRNIGDPRPKINVESLDEGGEKGVVFSPTSYGQYVSCPRKYMFGRVLEDPDNESTLLGNFIHQYAEFRVSYPDLAKKHDAEYYVDKVADLCINMYRKEFRTIEKSILRASIININRFVEEFGIKPVFGSGRVKEKPNIFFENESDPSSDNTEVPMTDNDAGIEGIIDLVTSDVIFDYKSGGKKELNKIMGEMDRNTKSDSTKSFQPFFYQYILKNDGQSKMFTFFYVKGNLTEFTKTGSLDYVENNFVSVKSYGNLDEFFKNQYIKALTEVMFPEASDKKDLIAAPFLERGIRNVRKKEATFADEFGLPAVLAKKIESQIWKDMRYANEYLDKYGYFKIEFMKTIFVSEQILDEFIAKVKEDRKECEERYKTDFPAVPMIDCKKCNFRDICTRMPLEGGESSVFE